MELIEKARCFAEKAHEGQVRKYTGEPYVVHCREVAELCAAAGLNGYAVCAAWLHDTVEDTAVTLEQIEEEFNTGVAELVKWLTDVSKPEDGNREVRKRIDRLNISNAPALAKSVKLADLISNTKSIVNHDPDFAKVYMREKAKLMPHLVDGDKKLFSQALKLVLEYKYGPLD